MILNNNLKIIQTKQKGKGYITTKQIPKNAPILEFKGTIETIKIHDKSNENFLQISESRYLNIYEEFGLYVNHSCDPNCYVRIAGHRAFLYSLYVIQPNSELTFDYSLTCTNTIDQWNMSCKCGSSICRNIISGFQYLSEDIKIKYKKLNILPNYIIKGLR